MPKKFIPNSPEKDYVVHVSYSVKLAIDLGSAERAQLIDIIHRSLQTKVNRPEHYKDYYIRGCWWTADTFNTWQRKYFPLVNAEVVRRNIFKPLVEMGVLIQDNFNTNFSRRGWYTLNYERLHELFPYTEKKYPCLNAGNPLKVKNDVYLKSERNLLKVETDTHLKSESLNYINKYNNNKTVCSTEVSTERSTEKPTLSESVKREKTDRDCDSTAEIFECFKNLTGKSFDDTESEKLIQTLLHKGFTVTDLVAVVKCKGDEWQDSEKMRPCIRPQTLFKAERFAEYLEQARNKGYVPKPLLPIGETLFNALSRRDQEYLTDTGCISTDYSIDFRKLRILDNGSRYPFAEKITSAINRLSENGDDRFSEYMFVPDEDMKTLRRIGFIDDPEYEGGRNWANVTDDIHERIILTYGIA